MFKNNPKFANVFEKIRQAINPEVYFLTQEDEFLLKKQKDTPPGDGVIVIDAETTVPVSTQVEKDSVNENLKRARVDNFLEAGSMKKISRVESVEQPINKVARVETDEQRIERNKNFWENIREFLLKSLMKNIKAENETLLEKFREELSVVKGSISSETILSGVKTHLETTRKNEILAKFKDILGEINDI